MRRKNWKPQAVKLDRLAARIEGVRHDAMMMADRLRSEGVSGEWANAVNAAQLPLIRASGELERVARELRSFSSYDEVREEQDRIGREERKRELDEADRRAGRA